MYLPVVSDIERNVRRDLKYVCLQEVKMWVAVSSWSVSNMICTQHCSLLEPWMSSTGNHREWKRALHPQRLILKSSLNSGFWRSLGLGFFPVTLSEAAKRAIADHASALAQWGNATFQLGGYLYLVQSTPNMLYFNLLLERLFLVYSSNQMHSFRCISGYYTL